VALTVLTSAAEVLLATDHDPYVRGSLRQSTITGWAVHGAVAWRATDAEERLPYLMTHGTPHHVALLIEELLPELRDQTRITLPRGTSPRLPAWVALDGTDWDFRRPSSRARRTWSRYLATSAGRCWWWPPRPPAPYRATRPCCAG
jgi:hypothetical protein